MPMMLSRRSMLAAPLAGGMTGVLGVAATEVAVANRATVPLKIQRLAWAGTRIELGGVTLFIDAIAPDPAGGQPGPPLTPGAGRNFALVTHHHSDHCDPQALKSVYCPWAHNRNSLAENCVKSSFALGFAPIVFRS